MIRANDLLIPVPAKQPAWEGRLESRDAFTLQIIAQFVSRKQHSQGAGQHGTTFLRLPVAALGAATLARVSHLRVQRESSLHADEQTLYVESLEHDFGHLLAVLGRV